MSSTVVLTDMILEMTTGLYTFEVVNELGDGIDGTQIEIMVLTYYDLVSGAIINAREDQNVKNANNVSIVTVTGPPLVTTVTWVLQPADTILVDSRREGEQHIALFQWSWNSGERHSAHEVQFGIEALAYVP